MGYERRVDRRRRCGPLAWVAVTSAFGIRADRRQRRDLLVWLALALAGLAAIGLAVRLGAHLGTAAAPFLGSYRVHIGPASLLAPLVAVVVLAAHRAGAETRSWPAISAASYAAVLAWALALSAVDGAAGLTSVALSTRDIVAGMADAPTGFLRTYAARAPELPWPLHGHPPGPALALWALHRAGVTDPAVAGLLIAAVGALTVPLVLGAVRGVCGDAPARRYAPLLVLAPYASWLGTSVDAVGTALAAAMLAVGVHASGHRATGPRAGTGALVAGLLLGVGVLFSYAVAWLGLSLVCLYFARRRAALNLFTGVGALLPLGTAQMAGFSWLDGLLAAHADFTDRFGAALWWSGISPVVLLVVCGPALYASLRKLRNTPAWPFLAGAGAAALFTLVSGLARGGVEHAWLAFFPWLTVAAVAPGERGGDAPPPPLLLAAAGAGTAIILAAALRPPWS